MKIGIIGAGFIAETVAPTLKAMKEIDCYAVASRSAEKARAFAWKHGFQKAFDSYEALVKDPYVELVYICTPHSHHYAHMMLAISHGKHVICEKAFTMNAEQAKKVHAAAKEKGVYVAEAIWTRYMPSRHVIQNVLKSGVIGRVNTLVANLSYPTYQNARIADPALAGGALLDVGVYGINFALMCFGDDIERIESSVKLTDTGVDGMETITMFYPDGRMAVLTHSVFCRSDRKGVIHGDKGYLVIENINNPKSLTVYDAKDRQLQTYDFTDRISGYEFEFLEAEKQIREGQLESRSMPMCETIAVMEIMDSLRKSWGVVYPQEQ